MHSAIALIALALGYKVFTDAAKEKEGVKLLGQVIGIIVMIASVLLMACGMSHCYRKSQCDRMSKSECPTMAKSSTCPMSIHQDESK